MVWIFCAFRATTGVVLKLCYTPFCNSWHWRWWWGMLVTWLRDIFSLVSISSRKDVYWVLSQLDWRCNWLQLSEAMYTFYMVNDVITWFLNFLQSATFDGIASCSSCASDKCGSTNGILVSCADPHIHDDTMDLGSSEHLHTWSSALSHPATCILGIIWLLFPSLVSFDQSSWIFRPGL